MRSIVLWQFSFGVLLLLSYLPLVTWWLFVPIEASPSDSTERPKGTDPATKSSQSMETVIVYQSPKNTANQVGASSTTTSTSANSDDDSLEEQLRDDQVALKRMVTILSLVGGLGAVAVVTTIVIFTKMRRRKLRLDRKVDNNEDNGSIRSQRHPRQHLNSHNNNDITTNDSGNGDSTEVAISLSSPLQLAPPSLSSPSVSPPSSSITGTTTISSPNGNSSYRHPLRLTDDIIQPSAPPSLTTSNCQHRQFVSLSLQQSTPVPSAPSAKELTSQQMDSEILCTLCDQQPQQHYQGSPEMIPPDVPPPAYTPRAPPLYNRPHSHDDDDDGDGSSDVVTRLTSLRRHSQH